MNQKAIKYFTRNPGKLFLVDAAGALLSALMLGVVLVKFQSYIGIPVPTLYFLAILPCIFVIYDLIAAFSNPAYKGKLLKVIAWINRFYCLISFSLAIYHFQNILLLGWLYLLLEIGVVVLLSNLEYKVGKRL